MTEDPGQAPAGLFAIGGSSEASRPQSRNPVQKDSMEITEGRRYA